MASYNALLTVGSAPHHRTRYSVTMMNVAFIVLLLPAAIAAIITQPDAASMLGIAGMLALGAGTGLLGEYLMQVVMRQSYLATNGHGALMGLLLAFILPASVPWWVLVMGVLVAIFVGKQIFGGIGFYPFHPAMVGWVILLLSWQHHVYPVGGASIAAADPMVIYATLGGGLLLALTGHIKWQISLGTLIGVALGAVLFQMVVPGLPGPMEQLLTGHVMLAAFFIGTDSSSSPANCPVKFIYGLCLGVMIMLVRAFGQWPDAIPFAVLLMNILNPLLDRIRPKVKEVVVQNG